MPPLLQIVLSNALMATALALLVMVIAAVARRPALTHVLWLLVLLKLITPGIIELPFSWPAAGENSYASDTTEPSQLAAPSASDADALPNTDPQPEVTLLIYPAADSANSDTPLTNSTNTSALPDGFWQMAIQGASSLWPMLAALWLAGSLLWLTRTTVQIFRFHRLLKHARLAPAELQEQVRVWSGRIGLRKTPTLWLVPGCISPMLWTLGRSPRLIFPAKLLDRLDAEQRSALLVHELAHLRRRDHWVRFLEMTVMAIYWWHPVVWWARRELHEAEEQCCDAWVVWALASEWRAELQERRAELREQPGDQLGCVSNARRAYALALLHTVDFFSHARPTLPAPASGVGPVPHLRRRLTMIMNGNTSKSLSAVGRLAVAACCLLLPLVPIQAQQATSQEEQSDSRDQIRQLKQALQALEEQQRAAQFRRAESLHRFKEEQARAENAEQQAREHLRALRRQEAEVAQNQDPEQPRREIRLRTVDDKASPEVQKAMQAIEEITKAIEVKRQEIRSLEQKLRQLHVDLEKFKEARADVERRVIRVTDEETHPEPLIIKIDPNVSPEQIKAQVEALQGKIKQPIRVEIVNPDGRILGRIESARPREPEKGPVEIQGSIKSARPTERRDSRKENLEEKLERIMKEVEELRRELRDSRKGPVH